MTQEEREAASAALALDELIEKRVWEILEKDQWRAGGLVLHALKLHQHNPELSNTIATALKYRL